jgi:hypothetical protein
MKNFRIAFKILNGDKSVPQTYPDIQCHMIFDVKMEDFWQDLLQAANASVVSRESVRIALTLAAFNDLDVKMDDIENDYLTAPITEKVWTVLGPECGDDARKRTLIVRALYGLKSDGAAFRNHLAECMKYLGWIPHRTDRDFWMKAETCPDDGVLYWAYILIYVDDILCVYHDPGAPLVKLDEYFKMK